MERAEKNGCEAGVSNAEFVLTNTLLYGRGCLYDVAEAKRYYLRALAHGFTPARQTLDAPPAHGSAEGGDATPSWLAQQKSLWDVALHVCGGCFLSHVVSWHVSCRGFGISKYDEAKA